MSQVETKPEELLRRRAEEWEAPRPEAEAPEEEQPF